MVRLRKALVFISVLSAWAQASNAESNSIYADSETIVEKTQVLANSKNYQNFDQENWKFEKQEPLTERQLADVLDAQGVDSLVINKVVNDLKQRPMGTSDSGQLTEAIPLKIGGVLTTSGLNAAFFVDNNLWSFDGVVNYGGTLMSIPHLFTINYFDGGFKTALEYKKVWVFVPTGVKLSALDGKVFGGPVFGRGLALGTSFHPKSPFYIQGGWVTDEFGVGSVYILTLGAGFVGYEWSSGTKTVKVLGKEIDKWVSLPIMVTFPKLEFKQNVLLPE